MLIFIKIFYNQFRKKIQQYFLKRDDIFLLKVIYSYSKFPQIHYQIHKTIQTFRIVACEEKIKNRIDDNIILFLLHLNLID